MRVTGIATARHGLAIDARGLDLGRALRLVAKGGSLDALHRGPRVGDVRGFIARVPADVLVEITTLDPRSGQPAIAHVRQALRSRDARRDRQQGAGRLRPAAAAGSRRAEEAALPARGRGHGRDARLQPRRALPARRAHRLLPRHAQQHHEPGPLAHGGRAHRERRGEGGPGARHRRGRPAERPRGLGRGGQGLRDRQRPDGRRGAAGAGAAARDRGSHRARRAARGAGGDAAAARRPGRPAGRTRAGERRAGAGPLRRSRSPARGPTPRSSSRPTSWGRSASSSAARRWTRPPTRCCRICWRSSACHPERRRGDGSRGGCRRAGGFLVARRDEAPRNDRASRRGSSEWRRVSSSGWAGRTGSGGAASRGRRPRG